MDDVSSGSLPEPYKPHEYWSSRLSQDFSLRGTGHWSYSEGYNRWLYRAKRRTLDRALQGTARRARALDVGSGVGWVVGRLRERELQVEGCDVTRVAVDRLSRRYPDATFFQVEFGTQPLPRENGSYDVVVALDVLYHVVDDAKWTAAVGEAGRLLRPGGRLILTDALDDRGSTPAEHVRFRGLSPWREAAAGAGLRITEVFPYFAWLSRAPSASRLRYLPDELRGAIEYTADLLPVGEPHMRCAVLMRE